MTSNSNSKSASNSTSNSNEKSGKDINWDPELSSFDPEVYDLIRLEQSRQQNGLELIASEVKSHQIKSDQIRDQIRSNEMRRPTTLRCCC